MFCPKCGTKALDGAVFCQKCGARLIVDTPTAQPAPEQLTGSTHQLGSTTTGVPKKKPKKLPVIIGIVALAVLAIIFIALNWEGKTDYEATVRAHTPFANSQGLPYTCGEVFDKYVPDASWKVRESSGVHCVDISGIAQGLGQKLVVTIEVSEDSTDSDLASIKPASIMVDDKELASNAMDVFFLALFVAYDEGMKDLSTFGEVLLDVEASLTEGINLTETYTNETEGISFNYPSGWELVDISNYGEDAYGFSSICSVSNYSPHANVAVSKNLSQHLVNQVFASDSEFLTAFRYDAEAFTEVKTSIEELDGVRARRVSYIMDFMDNQSTHQVYFYVVNSTLYQVQFSCQGGETSNLQKIFDAIMDSYAIAPLPNAGLSTSGTQVNSMDEAQRLFEDWLARHPIGPMAGAGNGAAANDVPSISAEYFVLELWEAPREFRGLVYVRKSDGYMTFHDSITDEEYDLDTWYEFAYSSSAKEYDNDLTLWGISLTDWIGGPADIAYDVFGWPDYGTIIDGSLYSGGEYFGYNVGYDSGISFVIDYQTDRIGWITGAAEAIEFNGTTLDMTRTKLIDLFGAPESEGAVFDELEGTEYYAMQYTIKGFPVEISMPNIDSAATAVLISQVG